MKEKKITMITLVTASEEVIAPKLKSNSVNYSLRICISACVMWVFQSYDMLAILGMYLNCNLK